MQSSYLQCYLPVSQIFSQRQLIPQVVLQNLLAIINSKKSRPNYEKLKNFYQIGNYKIEKISQEDIKSFHAQILSKYRTKKLKRTWCENQLRFFGWILFHFSHAIQTQIQDFKQREWSVIAKVFANKDSIECKFKWLTLLKSYKNGQYWSHQEDNYLKNIIQNFSQKNKWNQISKLLYRQSNGSYFRKPKQCRQRWRNYLDPQVDKGKWTPNEDKKLLQCVLEIGKTWSNISKIMKNRTEHSVKNRYKSIMRKFIKNNTMKTKKDEDLQEIEIIKTILRREEDEDSLLRQENFTTQQRQQSTATLSQLETFKKKLAQQNTITKNQKVQEAKNEQFQDLSKQFIDGWLKRQWENTILQQKELIDLVMVNSPEHKNDEEILGWCDMNKQEHYF